MQHAVGVRGRSVCLAPACSQHERGVFRGDIEGSLLWAGQAAALIKDIPSAREFIERMVAEARTSAARVSTLAGLDCAVLPVSPPAPVNAA